jgi:Ca2+-binding EF-hand superfamily protein
VPKPDGRIDLQEFVTGLSCLCKGTPEEKLALSFKAYDIDGNGYISKDELAAMFRSAWLAGFQALTAVHGEEDVSRADLEEFSAEMATIFADNAFDSLDTNHDGQLSFDEFKEFATADPKVLLSFFSCWVALFSDPHRPLCADNGDAEWVQAGGQHHASQRVILFCCSERDSFLTL